MTKNRIIAVLAILLAILFISRCMNKDASSNKQVKTSILQPALGDVLIMVATTGIVEPQNRLEIKPSINGRLEKILVKEGDLVKEGETLAWMSSTERAALIDAARLQGEEILNYWEEVYKKTPIASPISGEVIVRSFEPGQTITTSDAVLVISDRLVVNAQFDETDIGKIKVGQESFITLDAYPDIKLNGIVDHIAYESEVVNNVTIYNVDILPKDVPEMLRSGMSVNVSVVEKKAVDALTIPSSAIQYNKGQPFVSVEIKRNKVVERAVKIGLNNDIVAEVLSGLAKEDKIVVKDSSYLPKKKNTGSNPFMPSRDRNKKDDRTK
ncbi:MAG: efflux RND transporter periplasmic adaptor subunit [Candidatus Omnitrophota bacterium]